MKTFIFVLEDWSEIEVKATDAEDALRSYMAKTGQYSRWRAIQSFMQCFEKVDEGANAIA